LKIHRCLDETKFINLSRNSEKTKGCLNRLKQLLGFLGVLGVFGQALNSRLFIFAVFY